VTRFDLVHASGLVLVVASSLAIATVVGGRGARGVDASAEGGAAPGAASTGPRPRRPSSKDGREGGAAPSPHERDALEHAPVRIASATLLADGILAEIADPSRVVATTDWLDDGHPLGFRLAGKPRVVVGGPIEPLLALRPEVLFVSDLRDAARLRRLEEAGVRVVDLGPTAGLAALDGTIARVAEAIGAPARGEALRMRLRRRAEALQARAAARRGARPDALYVSAIGDTAWGGAAGTSYHDLLELAGFRDVATAAGMTGWPQLSTEQLLMLDPPNLVGSTGLRASVCGRSALAGLRACGPGGRVWELPDRVVSDPGPGLLDAAEALAGR
jgi:iron complex transport system substrate-binding protein